ncbi:MAG: hypothetical protein KUG78_18430 [Kangiellaceae bacterium]|nr:hypothetical protein [Kangiellaceae bacterium]
MTLTKVLSLIVIIPIIIQITACGGNSNKPGIGQGNVSVPESCDLDSQKQFIVDVMNDTYFWYDEVPTINTDEYQTIDETLDALRAPLDRFSYITTQEANDNFFNEGTFEGFGFRSIINQARDAYQIGYVFVDSPTGQAGWQRTDKITSINGEDAETIIAGDGISAALAELEVGDTAEFTVMHADQSTLSYTLTKAIVNMNTVLTAEVVQSDNQTIGYVALSSFIENTSAEFAEAMDTLVAANITELVLDLRYNGGGRVSASRDVASYIGGDNTLGFDFSRTIHNDKYTASNSRNPFQTFDTSLDLQRVYVLATSSTCSASELIINSLSPFVEVITIGGTTCGKPVGMYGKEFCDQIILPIEFQSVNHEGEGDYFDGLSATCVAEDDFEHGFADVAESMFSTAIFHMNNTSCPPLPTVKTLMQKRPKPSFVDTFPPLLVH